MEILLIERDRLARDQIKVGLQQFPEFTVTCGEGIAAINELRQKSYDCVFLGIDPDNQTEGVRLLETLRSFDRTTEVLIVTSGRAAKDMQTLKGRMSIAGFVQIPIEVNDFFRVVARFRERHGTAGPVPAQG